MAINFEENFELGTVTLSDFDSEQDTEGGLNIRNYKAIARDGGTPNVNAMPYRGAFALEADLSVCVDNHYLQENDGFDMAASDVDHIRFYIYVTSDLTMAASDRFTVLSLQSTGPVDEATICIRNNAGQYEILASETSASATVRASHLTLGEWHCVELTVTLDSTANDGTIDFYLDGIQVGTQITTLTQAATVQARLGAFNLDVGTTAGRVYISEIIDQDDTSGRVYPEDERWKNPRTFTKGGHLFVGPGHLDYVAVVSASADNVIRLFDTDEGDVTPAESWVVELDPDAHTSINTPTWFKKGCYVQLSGTLPRVTAKWVENSDIPGIFGPTALSDAGMRALSR